ncbi:MAG: hypothetical protein Q4C60_06265 [Eubacteriales bacterium]|nr:hypothetical protein [Eubacteriales bacterium]
MRNRKQAAEKVEGEAKPEAGCGGDGRRGGTGSRLRQRWKGSRTGGRLRRERQRTK